MSSFRFRSAPLRRLRLRLTECVAAPALIATTPQPRNALLLVLGPLPAFGAVTLACRYAKGGLL